MRVIMLTVTAFCLAASPASACLTKPKPAVAEVPNTATAEREKAAAAREKAAQERTMRKAGYERVYSRCGTSSWVKLSG